MGETLLTTALSAGCSRDDIVVAEKDVAAVTRKTKGSVIGAIVKGSGVVKLVL